MYEYLLSDDTSPLYMYLASLFVFGLSLMYISALFCALGTPSEFSSVPILVADELVLPHLVNPDPREIPYTELSPKSRTVA